MVRLYDERERGFEILGLEKVKKYLGEKFCNCKDAWEIDEIHILLKKIIVDLHKYFQNLEFKRWLRLPPFLIPNHIRPHGEVLYW